MIIKLLDWKAQQEEVCNSIQIARLIYNAKVCSQHKQTEDNQQSRQTFLEFGIM